MDKEFLQAMKKAVDLEIQGKSFYLKAAQEAKVEAVKEIFSQLAKEEDKHIERIKEISKLLEEGKGVAGWTTRVAGEGVKLVFDKSLIPQMKEATGEMEALEHALGFEDKAFKYYQGLAEETEDPKVKRFLLALASEEWSHYLSILDTIEFMRDPVSWFREKERWGLEG